MTWPTELLDEAERLVSQLVELHPAPRPGECLAAKLDVLERLVELLRLRAGRIENEVSMQHLLAHGVMVTASPWEGPRVLVGGSARSAGTSAGRYRQQSELQAALLLHQLHTRTAPGRIGHDLHHFVLAIKEDLVPADMETTRTGVTRIATTTRDAARALRRYGLLRDTDDTRTRKWELSLLGILTAVALSKQHPRLALPPRDAYVETYGRFAEGERLAVEVEKVVTGFRAPDCVARQLSELCARDADIFPSFNTVVRSLSRYCESLDTHWRALDERRRSRTVADVRAAADAMLAEVEAAVPPGALARDVNLSLSLDQAPGLARPNQT